MKKNEKTRRASKAVLIYYYLEEIKFNLITLKHAIGENNNEECFQAILFGLGKLFRVAKPKLEKTKRFYCVECRRVTQHKNHSYISRPLGFGGWDQDYLGLKCRKCGHVIAQNEIYWIGLKL